MSKPAASLSSGLGLPTYKAFGNGEVISVADLTATRIGKFLNIAGTVHHGFDTDRGDNLYNFDPEQPGHLAGRALEREGEAKPFRMQFDRKQSVDAVLEYGPDRTLTLRKIDWGKIE